MFSRNLQGLLNRVLISTAAMGIAATTAVAGSASGSFQKTGSMNVARIGPSSTLLSNGEVLVAGGRGTNGAYLASAELYNPSIGSWTFTGSMSTARSSGAVLLPNGEVLVAGGSNGSSELTSAELYNPSTGTWSPTGSMGNAGGGSLTLLSKGQVLAVEGTTAELYNPAAGTWTETGSPTSVTGGTLLQNGEVLAINPSINNPSELYNPVTGTWSITGSIGTTIGSFIAPRLSNGEVLVTGGFDSGSTTYSSASLYNPSTGQFTVEIGPCSCDAFNGAPLSSGNLLVAGGAFLVQAQPYPITETTASAELWNPSTQAWTSTGNLNTSRSGEAVSVLSNGQVLLSGSETFDKKTGKLVTIASAELYTP